MKFSHLYEDIYKAKDMTEHPERYTKAEMENMDTNLRALVDALWDFVGVFGQIMFYTNESRDAWQESNLFTAGEHLAMVSDLARGIEDIRAKLQNPEAVKPAA
ncbi:hypothetical protein [Acidithiobacillus caldus]|jgi:hypothetical protein|uniref:Uncharacterized protein n=2 Tax=Acidithiobacillus caldus TaxID=33059 RepID=F9ZPQ6_ACICS|nr:hypothetical protein [Acidithiobacillus caldus]AEK58479.1 conserved hypothetical protein [Acidithiobacillus caldus SM-1]AIA55521.1 hypothetical protein Acaty_c1661 [Acidithiobacillus caldus ATCC 51756]AUW33061.1 hypothetical protein A5904_09160 [Acidithiobacillus caldus]MBU2731186.1 hypothetical protein [Acidithiobacillus caldus]MBU2734410.1 hypothetical protein [Acidithiobacillus caldus ATCC 51756]